MTSNLQDYPKDMATLAKPVALSEHDLAWRKLAADNAVAQQELEGLTVSAETLHDLDRAARGEILPETIVENIRARLNRVSIFGS